MSYRKDLREKTMEFIQKGNSYRKAAEVFGIAVTTVQRWCNLHSKMGTVEKKELDKKPRKFESERLHAYMKAHPGALLKEIAAEFGGSTSGAEKALGREKITLKTHTHRIETTCATECEYARYR